MKIWLLIYLFSYILYNTQGIVLPANSNLGKFLLLLILSLNAWYFIKSSFIKVDHLTKVYTAFIIFIIISYCWGIVFLDIELEPANNVLKTMLLALSSYYFFYIIGRNNVDIKTILLFITPMLLALSVAKFYKLESDIIENRGFTDVVNNVSYDFVQLLPLIILANSKLKITLSEIAIIIFFVILGSKRGALLCLLGGLIIIYYYIKNRISIDSASKLSSRIIIFLVICCMCYFGWQLFSENTYFLSRFTNISEQTSGRDIIFEKLFSHFEHNDSIINILFGYGFNGTIETIGKFAHNDWIENAFDFGLVGLLLYISLLWSMIAYARKIKHIFPVNYVVSAIIIIWILKTLTTGVITGGTTFLMTMILGYCAGYTYKYNYK